MKILTGKGYGIVKHTDNLNIEDENQLWERGVISTETAKGPSHGGFFITVKCLGLEE